MELVQKLVNMEEDQQAGIGRDELLQEIRFLHEKNLSLEEEKHHLIKHQQQSNGKIRRGVLFKCFTHFFV